MNAKSRVETPVSAGGVVCQMNGGRLETVLCGRSQPVRWSLAKGTPDDGETLEQTALREVREETGLEVEIDGALGSIDYWFADRGKDVRYHKTAHGELTAPGGGATDRNEREYAVGEWFDAEEALKTVAYANEVRVLQRALDRIAERNGVNSGERA